jgi:glycosyltransferase involved in cell wall biosynthesis
MPSLWRTLGCAQKVKRDGVQIYHGLSHELPLGLPREVRRVVTMHDLIVRRYPHYFTLFDRIVHRLKQRHACRTADVVVAISEQTKRDLIDLMHVPENKIRVVYQSCDAQFWSVHKLPITNYQLPAKYILCVGTLEERKNQLTVIEAMKRLPEDVTLVIVGRPRGEYGRRVLAAAGNRVRILQGVAFSDFPALYAGAVASVYLSRFEGFGIPVLESLCCDCPVVTSNISSMPEAGGDAALYADPDDAETVAAHLNRLLSDEAFRQQCIEKGRTQRMKFAPEKVAADMAAVYKSLLDD